MNSYQMFGLASETPTFAERCKRGNRTPAYLPGTVGLKDVRLSAGARLHIRSATRISLSNGAADGTESRREYENVIAPRSIPGEFSRGRRKNYRPNGKGMIFY